MPSQLSVSVGQYSDKGRKPENQDFQGVMIPAEPQLSTKGIVAAIADGISTSQVSHIASQACVKSLLEDYYCTSETWSVKQSAEKVLSANNSWLYSQTDKSEYKYDKDKGYVCTLSALILKSTTAYIFHLGDSRIFHFRANKLSQLTEDHRTWVSSQQSYLARAMGIFPQLDLEHHSLKLAEGDIFILATDGVYEYLSKRDMQEIINDNSDDLNLAAKQLGERAFELGSSDNLSAQIIRVNNLPSEDAKERIEQLSTLKFPPILEARQEFDGFKILRVLHSTARSHVYLAQDLSSDPQRSFVLKAPSIALKEDAAHLERFLMEEWIAKRINSAHVLKPCDAGHKRNFLYTTFEYIEGQTLSQWMQDNPKPSLQSVRDIIEQIARGLMVFHRLEMLHQDLRPENIMIDQNGVVKIIDFGSTKVAGLMEMTQSTEHEDILGTVQFTAPEYFLGESGAPRSDLFSLAVICYQMLTGRLPYGSALPRARTKAAQSKLRYRSALHDEREIPAWVDDTLKTALHINPLKRYQELSEFVFDLKQPSNSFLRKNKAPLMERNPVVFWQSTCIFLILVIVYLLNTNN